MEVDIFCARCGELNINKKKSSWDHNIEVFLFAKFSVFYLQWQNNAGFHL